MKRRNWACLLSALFAACLLALFHGPDSRVNAADVQPYLHEEKLTLVQDGHAESAVVWWNRNPESQVTSFAASEIQRYVKQITGETIPVLRGTMAQEEQERLPNLAGAIVFVTGNEAKRLADSGQDAEMTAAWLSSADEKLANAEEDAFVAEMQDYRFVLAGMNDRGTLYAAYDLLESFGIRFYAPNFDTYGGNAEFVPRMSTLAIRDYEGAKEPDFRFRRKYVEEGWSHNVQNLPQLIDWMAKNKLNTLVVPHDYIAQGNTRWDDWREALIPELEKRGMIVEVGGHGFESFLRRDKYQAEHPDWFVSGYNVFNIANDEAVNAYVNEVIAYLRERPEIRIFDAWPPDGASWPPAVIQKFGSAPNAYAYVVKKLQEAADRELPGVRIEAIAYSNHVQPPDAQYMYDNSTVIDFAPYFRSYREAIFDPSSSSNQQALQQILAWRQLFDGDLAMYEYYRRYAFYSMPVVFPQLIGQELPYYKNLGMNGIGSYSEPADWITFEISHLILAKMSWDADIDAQQWISDFIQSRYGGAAEEMSEYFQLVEQAGRAVFSVPQGDLQNLDAITLARNHYLQAKTALENALAKAENESSAHYMIERLLWNIEYSIASIESEYYRLTGDAANERAAKLRAQDEINAHRFDGIILQNSYSTRRHANNGNTNWMYEMYRGELKYAPMVTTAGSYGNYYVSYMVDDNENTLFWSNANPQPGDYIGVDLGGVKPIRSIEILMASADKPNDYIRQGTVEISRDFKQWTTLKNVSLQPEIRLALEDLPEARFVRIRTTAAQTQWVQVREFRVETAEPQAEPRTALTANPESVRAGDSFEVTLGLEHVLGQVYALDAVVEYDPALIELENAESAKEGIVVLDSSNRPGQARIVAAALGETHAISGHSPVAKLRFKALKPAEAAQISAVTAALGSGNGDEQSVLPSSVAVPIYASTPLPSVPGDLNNDARVSIGDLAVVAAYYGKTSSDPDWDEVRHADVNEDGVIDIADLAWFAQRIIEFESEPEEAEP